MKEPDIRKMANIVENYQDDHNYIMIVDKHWRWAADRSETVRNWVLSLILNEVL